MRRYFLALARTVFSPASFSEKSEKSRCGRRGVGYRFSYFVTSPLSLFHIRQGKRLVRGAFKRKFCRIKAGKKRGVGIHELWKSYHFLRLTRFAVPSPLFAWQAKPGK